MRIVKYLFLLLLLSLVALSIFIATQKGEFTVERSKIINSQRASVFNYTNDLKNWKDWNSLAVEDSLLNITYSNNTIGKGSFCAWDGKKGTGEFRTISTKENESIIRTMKFNGNTADISMTFKDTLGKTKVTWVAKGKMSFTYKVLNAFNGGANKFIRTIFENSLNNLDKRLDYEINTYAVKVDGEVKKLETFYLAQTFTSEFSKVSKNSSIVFSKIMNFCDKNNVTISGKPFIIYHTYDTTHKLTKISICIPIKKSIYITEGSEISSDSLPSFDAVKTTLTGDYSHIQKALDKTQDYITKNGIKTDPTFSHIELYSIGKNEINSPSKWVTEIYYPTKTKPVYKPAPTTSTVTTATTSTEEVATKTVVPKASTPKPIAPKTNDEKEIPSEF